MNQASLSSHLLWAYPGAIAHALDAATWLDTTRQLRLMGWRVTLAVAGPADQKCIRGVNVVCLPRPDIYFLRQLVFHGRLLRLILRQWATVDVILFHPTSAPWLLPLRLLRRLTGRRRPLLVMDIRTLPMDSREGWQAGLRGAFQLLMSRVGSRWGDGYLVITQRMAEALKLPSEHLWGVWPSGVNLEQFASAYLARRWPQRGEPVRLIYIGALHHERNLVTLCRAVQQANTEGMAFHLTLLGDGTARAELEEVAGCSPGQISVRSPVPHDQVPQVLAQAHVGVLPFPDEEKFRVSSFIKLFEYMAAGLPILATRISAHTDVIGEGRFVCWIERSDADSILESLKEIWQDRDRLPAMGEMAAKASEAWTWEEAARKLRLSLERGLDRCS